MGTTAQEARAESAISDGTDEQTTARKIQQLLGALERTNSLSLSSSSSSSCLADEDRVDATRLDELRRIFARLYQQGELYPSSFSSSSSSSSSNRLEQKWKSFLHSSHVQFRMQLVQRIRWGKRTAVRTFWGVVASSPQPCTVGKDATNKDDVDNNTTSNNKQQQQQQKRRIAFMLDEQMLRQWIRAMAMDVPFTIWDHQSIQHMIQAEFFQPFRDVQYFAMISIRMLAEQVFHNQQQHKQSSAITKDKDGDDKNKNDNNNKDDQNAQTAERLLQMLMMIPIAQSQAELDQVVDGGKNGSLSYLFVPPQNVNPEDREDKDDEDEDDEDSNGDDTESDDDDDNSDDNDDDDDDNLSSNPSSTTTTRTRPNTRKQRRFPIQTLACHRRQWNKAWLAILRLQCLPLHCLKQALQFLPQHVLPVVSQPLLFADFFMSAYTTITTTTTTTRRRRTTTTSFSSSSYTATGKRSQEEVEEDVTQEEKSDLAFSSSSSTTIVPILALDGLFYLMTEHGLEYPKYYTQLYMLIHPTIFTVKFKIRFFELLDKSISRNDLLPAYIVAAMSKRLLRCCLQAAPPAAILMTLALVSNWLRKHPETNCLLHRSNIHGNDNKNNKMIHNNNNNNDNNNNNNNDGMILDQFDATTNDPAKANALHSSLWELSAFSQHYYPPVATMAASLGTMEESKLPMHNWQEFANLSYKTLLEQERKRKPKRSQSQQQQEEQHKKRYSHGQENDNDKKRHRKALTPLSFRPPDQGLFAIHDIFSTVLVTKPSTV